MLNNDPQLIRLLCDMISMSIWSKAFGNLLKSLFKELSGLIEKNIFQDTIFTNNNLENYSPSTLARMILGVLLGTSIQISIDPQENNISESLNIVSELL